MKQSADSPVPTLLGNKADWSNIIIITFIWAVMIILADPRGDFPLNDDWAYADSVKHLLETGDFQLPGWAVANLLPQVIFGALFCLPFGFSFTALRFSTLTLGAIGAIATYALLRETAGDRKIALIGALVLVANPLYFGLSHTFMTDVPHYTVTILSLYFFCLGIRKNSLFLIVLATLIAIVSLLIRQFTLALFCGYTIAYITKNKVKISSLIKAGFLFVLLPIAVQVIFASVFWPKDFGNYGYKEREIVSQVTYLNFQEITGFIYSALCAFLYLGCLLLPFLIITFNLKFKQLKSRLKKSLLIGILLFLVTTLAIWLVDNQEIMPLRGNVILNWGLGPLTLRDTILSSQESVPNYLEFFWINSSDNLLEKKLSIR